MNDHPIHQALRIFLELAALAALFYWGWYHNAEPLRYILAIGLPVVAGALWMVFRVPGDPGDAIVPVSGGVRLLLELALFGLAIGLLFLVEEAISGSIFAGLVLLSYLMSYDRVWRLLTGAEPSPDGDTSDDAA